MTINPPKRTRLAGDSVEALTKELGIKPCGGCKQRKAWLNTHDNVLTAAVGVAADVATSAVRSLKGR